MTTSMNRSASYSSRLCQAQGASALDLFNLSNSITCRCWRAVEQWAVEQGQGVSSCDSGGKQKWRSPWFACQGKCLMQGIAGKEPLPPGRPCRMASSPAWFTVCWGMIRLRRWHRAGQQATEARVGVVKLASRIKN